MQRTQLEIALRAAADALSETEFVLAGSQSVHAHTDSPPVEVLMSEECDVWVKARFEKLEKIASTLGKNSSFHAAQGFYVDPVDPGLVLLPTGWESRLKKMDAPPVTVWCLDVNDLVVSKLNAGRIKDYEFVNAMLRLRLADLSVLEQRIQTFAEPVLQARLFARLRMSLEGLP